MEREFLVFLFEEVSVGRLWARTRSGGQTASFEYQSSWLSSRSTFSIDPEIPLTAGLFHTQRPLFNAFTDPAPDRWGQTLLRRNERARARKEGRPPRTLGAIDFLALVEDETRLGALRFREAVGGGFLSSGDRPVPPLVELPRLLSATQRIDEDRETDQDLRLLLAPGTSLGGARPKASVRDRDQLCIAKFPRRDDEWPVILWEAVCLALGKAAGVEVPKGQLRTVLKKPVLILRRFDREGRARVPFMSALTALAASDTDTRSYLELVEFLRREGSEVDRDLRQLWRRVVFNILVSNTDDHLRNHAFLRDRRGWRLAPAYDVNPMPVDVKPRMHALTIDEADATSSLDLALSVAKQFGLARAEVRSTVGEVAAVVSRWRSFAKKVGLTKNQIERMASAFDHEDLRAALAMTSR